MQLSWSDPADIAAALLRAHPETDRLTLAPEQLRQMVISLPGFADAALPPTSAYLDHIRWTWMRLSEGIPGEGVVVQV